MQSKVDRDLHAGNIVFGRSPALIVVDMSNGFTCESSPLGGDFDVEIENTRALCELFQCEHWPVFYTTVEYDLEANPDETSVNRNYMEMISEAKFIAIVNDQMDMPYYTVYAMGSSNAQVIMNGKATDWFDYDWTLYEEDIDLLGYLFGVQPENFVDEYDY